MLNMLRINIPVIAAALTLWGYLIYLHGFTPIAEYYGISLAMLGGAFIAGASAEGGGAIAFPVLTLLFAVPPAIGAMFSLAIQSVGMTAASHYIIKSKTQVAWPIIKIALPTGMLGYLISWYWIAGHIPPLFLKFFFTSFWLSFGLVLWWQNTYVKKKETNLVFNDTSDYLIVVVAGFLGGGISALVGSGIDILCFSLITLKFGLCEKVATPTSIILMAGMSIFGTALNLFNGGIPIDVQHYLVAAIPIVIFCAPLGAWFVQTRSRRFVASLLYCILIVQYIGAFYILQPDLSYYVFSAGVLIFGVLLFKSFKASPETREDKILLNNQGI